MTTATLADARELRTLSDAELAGAYSAGVVTFADLQAECAPNDFGLCRTCGRDMGGPLVKRHVPDPDPEQSAYDVCERCGKPIREYPELGAWATTLGRNPECYGRN